MAAAEGVEQLEIYFGKYSLSFFYSLLALCYVIFCSFFYQYKGKPDTTDLCPLIPASIIAVQKLAKKLLNKYWGFTRAEDSSLENLQGLTTLKIYQADEQKAEEMDRESQLPSDYHEGSHHLQLNSTSVMDMIAYGGAAAGMIAAISEFAKGNVAFGGTFMIILLASEFFIPLRLLGSFFHIAMNGMAASDKIFALLDLPEEEGEKKSLAEGEISISLTNVQFSYEKKREIFKNVSIDLPAGSFLSVVGVSGCGKSTIAGILMGRNKNHKGSTKIQTELSDISEKSLMEHITSVGHNSYLFKGTVRDNLRLGKRSALGKRDGRSIKTGKSFWIYKVAKRTGYACAGTRQQFFLRTETEACDGKGSFT